ncbi:hypothetical protein POSPLADRAFT_1063644 [Postia placenta MAD-698-R-SB12]|uniref:Uncharacterized protein n=1 Tax=Postia placenta MAD-698-R-SB12 TaxID=670580 RepID=A0A1X6MH34_9APHY|nr:hypothetical protein POSPLADRAFT_1063644 [Postia placenta MAD-698-R-SB12]OSX55734.1 hypothetical protein POSPLADRAFT_1063644 [Postia placenta MAD-698-R-SB12]
MSRHLRCLPAVGRVYKPAARIPAGALARTSRAPQRRLPYPRTPEVYPSTENPPTAKRVRFARATRTFLPGNPTASARPAAGHRNRALLARAMTAGPGPGTACPNVPARRGAPPRGGTGRQSGMRATKGRLCPCFDCCVPTAQACWSSEWTVPVVHRIDV